MNQTANFGLNQWVAEDRIMMQDFNSDNAKLDAALKAIADANPYRKIISVVTQTAAQQIDLVVSGIDFTQYYKIELFVDCPTMTNGYLLRVNGISASSYIYNQISGSASGGSSTFSFLANIYGRGTGAVLFYSPAAAARVGCVYMTSDVAAYNGLQTLAPLYWPELTAFNIVGGSSSTLLAGTKITLLGVKK